MLNCDLEGKEEEWSVIRSGLHAVVARERWGPRSIHVRPNYIEPRNLDPV